jgi:hypothetical protein
VSELDRSLVEEIRAYNWLDAELHAAFATDEHSISLHQIR